MASIPVFSFVAFSGTGKTTLIEKLIAELKLRDLRVAVIKHDAHEFEIDREGKDSWRFSQAGADVTVIASSSKAAVMENRPVDPMLLISRITDVDIIVTEGFKHGRWPKIAIMRSAVGTSLPIEEDDCFAIVSDFPVNTSKPCFALDDIAGIASFILSEL